MPPDSAAAILSGMSAEAAYGISVIVAGRNAAAPKE
jgi:flagellar motility protein MotE (MotC chaperone)